MPTKKKTPQDVRSMEKTTEETREQIGEDLRGIGDKLTPENIKEGIKTEAKEAVGHVKDTAMEKLRGAKESASEAGEATMEFAKDNAIPLALIGAGLGWLFATRGGHDGGGRFRRGARRFESTEPGWGRQKVERAEEWVHEGVEKGRHLGHRAKERAYQARRRSREVAKESPLAMGALAAAAGVGVGLMLPMTRKEEEMLGPARARFVGEARGTAQQIGQTVKETAREAKEKVKEPMTH